MDLSSRYRLFSFIERHSRLASDGHSNPWRSNTPNFLGRISVPSQPTPEKQLASFIEKFTPEIATLANAILTRMRSRYPHALEIVYDNYNALAIGFGPTDRASEVIFSIALYPKWVSLFFMQAAGLKDPSHILKGSGNVAKHVVLPSPDSFDDPALMSLMEQALETAKTPMPSKGAHQLIIKSISAKQRPRRPAK